MTGRHHRRRATRRIASAAPLIAVLFAGAATAQLRPVIQTGSHIPTNPVAVDAARQALVQRAFAQCMYRNNPRAAGALLSHSDPLTNDLHAAGIGDLVRTFGMEGCLGREAQGDEVELGMKMPGTTVRTMLAEQAYLAARRQRPTLAAGSGNSAPRPFVTVGAELATAQGLAALSDCVAAHDPAKADALLQTVPGSAPERAAARALAPVLGGCLVVGQQFSMNVKSIRAIVADGLWNRFARPAMP